MAPAGVAACVAVTTYYLAEHPAYHRPHPPAVAVSLPPVTVVVLAVALAGCLWLGWRPPRWLLPDRPARRFGVGMAVALAAGAWGANLGNAVWWPVVFLVLWAAPLGVLGAAAGGLRARRRRARRVLPA